MVNTREPRRCAAIFLIAALSMLCAVVRADDGQLTREQALSALKLESAQARFAGVQRLGDIGTAADVRALLVALRDADANTREEAERAIQRIWTRSGDAGVDAMFVRGVRELGEGNVSRALSTFNEIIRLKPEFAEGWNKRATLYFLIGDYMKSMRDCDEVLKRNPDHFGALAGYGQIFLELKNYERSLEYFQKALNVNPNLVSVTNTMYKVERLIEQRRAGQI
jgi:tetratricopeptide (TPR) repeat protein